MENYLIIEGQNSRVLTHYTIAELRTIFVFQTGIPRNIKIGERLTHVVLTVNMMDIRHHVKPIYLNQLWGQDFKLIEQALREYLLW